MPKRQIVIEKYTDEELGLEFEAAVFDGVTTCYNNCVFCFVDQMIPGMRESLYVRDTIIVYLSYMVILLLLQI